ncbi:MAG TPA: biotin/lipoate A/B protein ligase family protein [Burkholderiales bacterium]|jgi:lipoate-protein ligase A|nr:biotin/lipoate A/B protein ligase family protein [Burkholderiales bacterium]
MSEMWRVIDTGLRPAAQNIALNRALLEARQANEIPSTLRFLRFVPSALLGYHQSAEQELNLDYCKAHNIAIQRRITGGIAMYTDDTQLDWELYLHQRDVGTWDMQAIAKRICHAAASAISALGVDARFRPRHDIEVDGKRISASCGVFDANALLYQSALLIDTDVDVMLRVLRVPARKESDEAAKSVRERVASLQDLLGYRVEPALIKRYLTQAFESEFDIEFEEDDLTLTEHARYRTALGEIETADWVQLVKRAAADTPIYEAAHRYSGGTLDVSLIYDRPRHRIKQICFSGDIAVTPRRALADLEAALSDTSVERLENNVRAFFKRRSVDMPSLRPDDFVAVIRLAVKQPIVAPSRA